MLLNSRLIVYILEVGIGSGVTFFIGCFTICSANPLGMGGWINWWHVECIFLSDCTELGIYELSHCYFYLQYIHNMR